MKKLEYNAQRCGCNKYTTGEHVEKMTSVVNDLMRRVEELEKALQQARNPI
jgi:hypothetical protein